MKTVHHRIANLFRSETSFTSSLILTMRRNFLIVGFFTLVLIASKSIAEAHLSLSSLPFLRGGYIAFAPSATKPLLEKKQRTARPVLFGLVNLQRTINVIGNKIQSQTTKQWSDLNGNVGREWGKLTSSIGKVFSSQQREGTRKLDEVLRAFNSVLNGSQIASSHIAHFSLNRIDIFKMGTFQQS